MVLLVQASLAWDDELTLHNGQAWTIVGSSGEIFGLEIWEYFINSVWVYK